MKRNNIKGTVILTIGSLIWGLAFVVQNAATDLIAPFAFNSLRSLLGAFVIWLFLFVKSKATKVPIFENTKEYKKSALSGGVICGLFLFLAVNFQQVGLSVYPKGVAAEARAGFLTALYVIFVPIASVLLKKRIPFLVWVAVIIATVGIYFLCMNESGLHIYLGDVLMILCAVSCTAHILFVDKYCITLGGPQLSFIQFVVCGVLSGIVSIIFEPRTTLDNIYAALPLILYMGIMSSGVAYTLQIVGQKYTEPAIASIPMSFESVFATLGGWIIMNSRLNTREIFGCVLMFCAIITAQLPDLIALKKR